MKKNIFRLLFIIAVLLNIKVSALSIEIDSDEIPANSYVVGSQLFTSNDSAKALFPEKDFTNSVYNDQTGITIRMLMLGATTIYSDDYSDIIIYYKGYWDDWGEGISGDSLTIPETFKINYVNGVCVDTNNKCNATVGMLKKATFRYTNFEGEIVTDNVSFMDGTTVTAPTDPVRLGSEFVCWVKGENPDSGDCYEFTDATEDGDVFTARFKKVNYSINYNLNGGSVNNATAIAEQLCTFDTILDTDSCELYKEYTPTKDGYVFLGWSSTNSVDEKNNSIVTNSNLKNILVNTDSIDDKGTKSEDGKFKTYTVTLYAIWKPAEYTITYNLNGGDEFTGYVDARYTILDNITLTTPTRTGYTFDGWYEDDTKITSIENRTGNISLTARWIANKITISYYGDSVNIPNQTCDYNTCVVANGPASDEDGFAFKYWATMNDEGNYTAYYKAGSTITGITSNTTLYAVFDNSASYNITYDMASDESLPANVINEYNSNIGTILPIPTKTGYTFTGWQINGTGSYYKISPKTTGDLTFTASWVKNTYSYGVYVDDDESILGGTANYNDSITLPSVDDAKNENNDKFYTLSKWYEINSDSLFDPGASVTIDSNKVFIPIWNISSTYNYVFDVNGGEGNNITGTYNYGSENSITVPTATRAGYTFAGWEEVNGSATIASNNVSVTDSKYGNLYFKAKWIAKNYKVQFKNSKDSTISREYECKFGENCSITGIFTPTNSDSSKVFAYWQQDGSDNIYAGEEYINPATYGDIVLYPVWANKDRYAVTYDLDGGSISGDYNTAVITGLNLELPTVTKDGYSFKNWTVETGNALVNHNTETDTYVLEAVTSDVKVKANFEVKKVALTYNIDGSESDPIEINYNDPNYTVASYSGSSISQFIYWTGSNGYTYLPGDKLNLIRYESAITLTAHFLNFAPETHNITYILNGGTAAGELADSFTSDDTFALGLVTKENYRFSGWTTDADGTNYVFYASDLGDEDVTLYAQWEQLYTITYNLNGGTVVGDPITEFAIGDTMYLGAPTKENYEFLGWTTTAEGTTYVTSTSELTGNVTLYAQWNLISYAINYYDNGNTYSTSVDVGDSITVITASGSDLRYWVSDGLIFDEGDTITPESNMDFYASYISSNSSENHTIAIHYPESWGARNDVYAYTEGDIFPLPDLSEFNNTSYSNYSTFGGWAVGSSTSDTIITSVTGQDTDLVLYSVWYDSFGARYYELNTNLD